MARLTFRNKVNVSPSDVRDDDAFALKVVAVAGLANDWTAYQGPSSWTDAEVAEGGDKITESAARALFYVLHKSGRRYRY